MTFFRVPTSQCAKRWHFTNKIQECLCAKHKADTLLLRAKEAKCCSLGLTNVAVTKPWGARRQVRCVRCGCFPPPASVSAYNGSSEVLKLCKEQSWRLVSVHCNDLNPQRTRPRTRPPAIPFGRRRRRWVCLLFFSCMEVLPAITIFSARWHAMCCFTGIATFGLA